MFNRGNNLTKKVIKNGKSYQESLEQWKPLCPQCGGSNTYTKGFFKERRVCNDCGCQYEFERTYDNK